VVHDENFEPKNMMDDGRCEWNETQTWKREQQFSFAHRFDGDKLVPGLQSSMNIY